MPGITALPAALRECRMIPLKPGTKTPDVRNATYDAAARWDEATDSFLARRGRVGIFMGGYLVGLDIDIKIAYRTETTENEAEMVMATGFHDVDRLLAIAGLPDLPKTLQVRTPSGGTHFYFRQNPAFPVTQCTIGCLDIRAARNSYLAIGDGYELVDDGGENLAVLPEALARAIMSVPHNRTDISPQESGERDGSYGDYDHAFNSALTTIKGTMVGLGWSEQDANEAIRAINAQAPDPIEQRLLEQTVLRDKGWEEGYRLRKTELEWAREQAGIEEGGNDQFLDLQTVKRLWTTDRYRAYAEMQQLDPPEREQLETVFSEDPPEWVMEGLMTAGLYGLAGPQEAGKSLLIRDWLDAVANGKAWRVFRSRPREVTYVISEGHFDLKERFEHVKTDNIFIYRKPVKLNNESAVEHFIEQHDGHDTGLVVFDIIYHMGVSDDNTSKDVGPVLKSCRKIADALNAAVVVVGHPGHNTGRRFRGTSIWRNWFDGEFHMSDGQFTCEKHKYIRKDPIDWAYDIEWPHIRFLSEEELVGKAAVLMFLREGLKSGQYSSDAEIVRQAQAVFPDRKFNTLKAWVRDVKKQLGP